MNISFLDFLAIIFMIVFYWIMLGNHRDLLPGNTDIVLFIGVIWAMVYLFNRIGEGWRPWKSVRVSDSIQYPENWEEIRKEVLKRDDYRCGNCGGTNKLHVHHIVPLSKGGSNNLSNLRTLCKDCHEKIHPHMKD